jgi:leucyl-tRNA synthetase
VSKGVLIDFKTTTDHDIKVFTTRADTIYGVSYIAVSPENALALNLTTRELMEEVYRYIQETKTKSEVERKEEKTKTGVFTGNYAINPFNNKQIPIYITDYVINNYATGMVMGVPAHDQRDYDFAKAYGLEITKVIDNDVENEAYDGTGTYINSDILNGFTNQQDAIEKITNICKERKIGQYYTTTKLHD